MFRMTRYAMLCLTLWTSLFNCGCAARREPEIEPVIVYPSKCARPARPELPKLAGLKFLESREAYSRIRLRDSVMRTYIAGLEDALDCYEAQLPQSPGGE